MNKSTPMRSNRGFTLIELMVVVVIIGVLAKIAIPSYLSSVQKSRRTDAKSSLVQLAQFMERNYTLYSRYDQDNASPPNLIGSAAFPLPFTVSPQNGKTYYNLSLQGTASKTAYILQAVPIGSQANDSCGTLSISNTGAKLPTTSGCW